MAKYLMLNSEILQTSKPCLSHDNRGLLYADAFSFDLRGNSSKAFFADMYFDYMISTIKHLKMDRPLLLKKSIFATDLELLLQKNRIYKGFCAKVTVFRNSSGTKLASDNSVSVMISVDSPENEYYTMNQRGLKLAFLKNYSLPDFVFIANYTPYFNHELLLSARLAEAECDDFFITDINGNIVKSMNSNVFFVKDGNLIIPERIPADSGKIFNGIIIRAAGELKIPVVKWGIRREDLYELDEIFLADVKNGITWVLAYSEKRFFHRISSALLKKVNEIISNV